MYHWPSFFRFFKKRISNKINLSVLYRFWRSRKTLFHTARSLKFWMRRNVKERRWRLDFSLSFVRIKLQYTSKEPKGGIPTFLPMIEGSCERENSLRSWRHCYIRGTHFLDLLPTLSRLRRQKRTYIPPIPPATQATTRCKSTPVRHCSVFWLKWPVHDLVLVTHPLMKGCFFVRVSQHFCIWL